MADRAYYERLGVSPKATADDIKRAYRKLARKCHPDIDPSPTAEARFKAAAEAYDVLRDPAKRAAYDRYGPDWEMRQAQDDAAAEARAQAGQGQWNTGYSFDPRTSDSADEAAFHDFFQSAFRAQAGAQGATARGADQHADLVITLQEAIKGGTRPLALRFATLGPNGQLVYETKELSVQIPKGIAPGQHIRLRGQGAPGPSGGPPGDLFLAVNVEPHPVFRLDGRDIYVDLPVTPWEAALGDKVVMPTPTGRIEIIIPPQARSGQKLRVKGRGLPGPPKGDLFAVLHIVNPPMNSAETRRLYENLARDLRFDPRAKLRETRV